MAGYQEVLPTKRKLTDGEEQEIIAEVRDNIEEAYEFERENRAEAEVDLRFMKGDQWPQAVKNARGTTRPMLTINQLPVFVHQVTNPTREADIAIKASPIDNQVDPQVAKIYNDLIRDIEYQSSAKAIYVAGNEQQTSCGIGYWQVCIEYVDDAIFDKEIKLRKVEHPLAVYCDPAAVLPDRSDAMWKAVIEQWPARKFRKQYPDKVASDVSTPNVTSAASAFQWRTQDTVAVAMYFRKVPATKTLAQTQSGRVIDITEMDEMSLMQVMETDPITETRECHTFRVEKFLVTGTDVLEGPIAWPGKYIPLVPVLGSEIPSDNGTYRHGIVRFARDPQQLLNFYRTAAAEQIALAPKAPYMVTPKQVGEHKRMWDTLNFENRPYLFYSPDVEAPGPPKREHPPETPVALIQQGEVAADDMHRTTNIYPPALGARSNETSGVAIQKREDQGATANSHYSDNLVHSLTYTGKVLVDLIPRIYDNERVLTLRNEQDEEYQVAINQVVMGLDGQPVVINDLSNARFNIRVTVGRSYLTKRIEAINAMLEFAKALPPEAQMLFIDLIAKNSDWPGAEELAKRFRNMVPQQALADPNDPNAPKPPGPMDDPLTVAQLEKLAAEIDKIKADAEKTIADRDKVYADTLKALAETEALEADTDHNILIPSVTGDLPVSSRKPPAPVRGNGAAAPPS